MKIIVPMAGRGTRMRPHTLTTPKPLIKIAGKPIVQRLVEDLAEMSSEKIDEIAFVIGDFGDSVEKELIKIANDLGAEGTIYYQNQPLGTAHAILCAADSLEGNVIVAFADTLFKADFIVDKEKDGVIWVQKVDDPSRFGVVKCNSNNEISDFIEKPQNFVSDLAIIGIYYFKDGKFLREELEYLVENNIHVKGEFQLTDALENMKAKGTKFIPGTVTEWLDCGNKDATVNTNKRYLEFIKDSQLVAESSKVNNSVIIEPVYLGENVTIKNSVIGPHVSVGENTEISNSVLNNVIVQENTTIEQANIANSMLGNSVIYKGRKSNLSIGDFNVIMNE